jgi:hypothetical protein
LAAYFLVATFLGDGGLFEGEVLAMKVRLVAIGALVLGMAGLSAVAADAQDDPTHQPPGVSETLQGMASEHATHTAVTFDREMLQSMNGMFGDNGGPVAGLNSITVENYRYHEPAFYVPENFHALVMSYEHAGWTHLVDQKASPRDSTTPTRPLTDLWLHFKGTNVDGLTVVVRGPKQMSVIEVSGILKPLDLVHLSGHFGIPKVDPSAVMVPAAPGK